MYFTGRHGSHIHENDVVYFFLAGAHKDAGLWGWGLVKEDADPVSLRAPAAYSVTVDPPIPLSTALSSAAFEWHEIRTRPRETCYALDVRQCRAINDVLRQSAFGVPPIGT